MKLYVLCIFIGAFLFEAQAQTKTVCQLVLDCLQDTEKAQQQCQSSTSQNKTKKVSKGGDCDVSDLQAQIKSKTLQQKQDYANCLKERMSMEYDTVSLKKGKQQQHCQDAIQNYQNPGSSQTSISNTRVVRQSPQGADDSQTGGTNGNSNGKGGGKGKGKGHKSSSPQQQCQKDAKQKFKRCKTIAECCSETTICHLKFELSPLHDEIRKLQQDVAMKKHDCDAKKAQNSNSNSNTNSNSKLNTAMHDDPIQLDNKGESMQTNSEETSFNAKEDLDKFYIESDEDDNI